MNSYRPRGTPVAPCEAEPLCECSTCYLAYNCQMLRYGRSMPWPSLAMAAMGLAAMGLFAIIGSMA